MSDGYSSTPSQRKPSAQRIAEASYKRTLTRLDKIQQHIADTPRANKLKGKVAIITGVGSLKGIGRAAALLFAHQGARHLYLIDYVEDNLPNLKETIESKYSDVKVTTIQADAADDKAISSLCARAILEEGRLDVFFANAGIATGTHIWDTDAATFENTMRVNALSAFLALKYGSAAMKKLSDDKSDSWGSIIMTASVAGLRAGAGSADYSSSKAAVISLAQLGASQLPDTNIRVNALCPGLIETGMTTSTFDYARAKGVAGKIGQLNPQRRFGMSEGIAQVALFLASDDSSYINGQAIAVDGGLSASHPVALGKMW
ncbi:uncharacterized protein EI90DRAFT_2907642 [Cantharellus anzutake]|uniref:uncharacterized protein n=1 Tax=Cantharellus anzutake TaxID=1750568 RepID=UPI001905E29D|nr:uncharacterized protein EI90DRAFT_2907642 [Cantharellus anzutake]KAF8339627.1 hypothetical protein EI90DRAFT_2907642 [Cantharellus anzutake]